MSKGKKLPEHPPFPKTFAQQRISCLAHDFREATELENTIFFIKVPENSNQEF